MHQIQKAWIEYGLYGIVQIILISWCLRPHRRRTTCSRSSRLRTDLPICRNFTWSALLAGLASFSKISMAPNSRSPSAMSSSVLAPATITTNVYTHFMFSHKFFIYPTTILFFFDILMMTKSWGTSSPIVVSTKTKSQISWNMSR